MWEGYVSAVQEALPHATIVIDRFHVARHYRDSVDQLRKQEVRRLRATLPDELQDDLKHILWPSRKRPTDLNDEERAQREERYRHDLVAPRVARGRRAARLQTRFNLCSCHWLLRNQFKPPCARAGKHG